MNDEARRVLVIDDNELVRDQLRYSLEVAGYKVDEASCAREALDMTRQEKCAYAFVLMDLFLPLKSDGLDLTRAIMRENPEVRVIVLTQYGGGEFAHEALDAGAYRYVLRPCPEADIIAVMQATDHLQELQEQLKQESPLRTLIDRAGIGISIIDRSFRILYMNEEQRRISRPGAQVGGICWAEYDGDWNRRKPCPWCPTKPAMADGKTCVRTTTSLVKGQVKHFSVVACPITGDGAGPIGAIEFVRDTTLQHQADQRTLLALEADDARLRLQAILAHICALGYSRARLYELSEDESVLRGRVEQGGVKTEIDKIILVVKRDPYSERTLESERPILWHRRELGETLWDEELDRTDIDEWLDVPLRYEDRPMGKITIDNKPVGPVPPGLPLPQPQPLTDSHYDELMRFAASTAREIFRERGIRREMEETKQLRKLRDLAQTIVKPSKMEDDLQELVKSVATLKEGGEMGVHLRLYREGRLELQAGCGKYYETAKDSRHIISVDDEESGSARAWREGKPYIEPDAVTCRNFLDLRERTADPDARAWLDEVKSYACFPIVSGNEALGVLGLQSDQPGFFGPSLQRDIEDFLNMIAPLIRVDSLLEELKAADRQLREAGRMAAHRIGGIDFALQGRVKLWRDRRAAGKLDDRFTACTLDGVGEDASRIASVIRDLRRFLKGAEVQIPRAPIDVNRAIQNALQGAVALHPGVQLELSLAPDLPRAFLDGKVLGEAVAELVLNACYAMEGAGTVTVKTLALPTSTHDGEQAPERIQIVVQDTGPGFTAEKRKRAFEPFFTTRADGNGLGLSFVRDAVQGMRGEVILADDCSLGARFIVTMPIHHEARA